MYIKKIALLLILFPLIACQKAENKTLTPTDSQVFIASDENSKILINEYKQIKLPFDSKAIFANDKFIDLDKYLLNQKDLKLFYSGKDQARILMTTVKKIGNKEYLLSFEDDLIWFAYPKGTSKRYMGKTNLTRDKNWDSLSALGYKAVRMVSIDSDWTAFRVRNLKYIKKK